MLAWMACRHGPHPHVLYALSLALVCILSRSMGAHEPMMVHRHTIQSASQDPGIRSPHYDRPRCNRP